MTKEVAFSNAKVVNPATQTLSRISGTITNTDLSMNMLQRFRTVGRNALHAGRSLGDVYVSAKKGVGCPDCTKALFAEARTSNGACYSMHIEAQSRILVRGFTSWAANPWEGVDGGSQRFVSAHAEAESGNLASLETPVCERLPLGMDGEAISTEVGEADREDSNADAGVGCDGPCSNRVRVALDGGGPCGEGEQEGPQRITSVDFADVAEEAASVDCQEVRSASGEGSELAVSSSGGSSTFESTQASELDKAGADSSVEFGVTGLDSKRKASTSTRRAKAAKSSTSSLRIASEAVTSSRARSAKNVSDNKKDAAVDAPKSKVFKETGRRPMAPAVRVASEERRRKEEMKGLPATDLLTVKGIGPKYVGRFMEQGIKSVKDLEDVYLKKYYKKTENMIAFLQSDIGVKQAVWAKSIVDHIEKSIPENEESAADEGPGAENTRKKPLTLCVEGNISVGKSTFLRNIVRETIFLKEIVDISPEPVEKWQSVGEDRHNILQSFYQDPKRYAYTFQNYVFFTRMLQAQEKPDDRRRVRLMERSVFSDRMVFVRAVHEAKYMSDMEISIYDSWFDPILTAIPTLVPDGFIYLRANPDTCFNRLKKRARSEETAVNLDYLQNLHEKHEQWLIPDLAKSGTTHSLRRGFNLGGFPDDIQDDVFSLVNNEVHQRIKGIPALVLDCDPDMDIEHDVEKKEYYARKVRSFYEHIEKLGPASDRHVIQPPGGIVQPTAEWYAKMSSKERYEEAAVGSGGRLYGL